MKSFLVVLAAFFSFFSLGAQNPWLQSRAGAYVELVSQETPTYSKVLNQNGDERPLPSNYSVNTTRLYSEYGIHPRLTLASALPFTRITRGIGDARISHSGMSNVMLAARAQLRRGAMPLTFTLRVDAPVQVRLRNDPNELVLGYPATTFLPILSTGQRGFRTRWSAYAGYGWRTRKYSDIAQAGAEFGVKIKDWWLTIFSDWVQSSRNKRPQLIDFQSDYAFFTNNQSWWTAGLKTSVELNRFFGVTANITPVISGHSVTRQPSLGIGGYFKWE